jgi:phosphoglycolate phosphatase-like HAD superfamily hydrolase
MKLLIFDIDGTLIDLSTYDGDYFEDTINMVYGIKKIDKNWRQFKNATDYGILSEIIMDRFGRELGFEEFLEFEAKLEETYLSRAGDTNVHALTGANDFVDEVKKNPYMKIGIATGNSHRIAEHKLNRANFISADFVIASSNDSMHRDKILMRCEERAKERHSVESFERIIYFGDRVWDFNATKDAGYDFIGIGRDVDELVSAGAEHCMRHFDSEKLFEII